MNLTNYLENKLIDFLFRGQSYTPPSTLYVALFTTAPTDASSGTEVGAASYARVGVTSSVINWAGTQGAGSTVASTGTGGQTSNNELIEFGTPTENWGTIVAFGLMDAALGGNLLIYGSLSANKTVNNGDGNPLFQAGTLSFTLS